MAKLYEVSLQIVGSDQSNSDKIQIQVEQALGGLKADGVFVREVTYSGDIEEEDDEE